MNKCGSCTLCCKLTAVPEFGKPVNQWCKHCKPDRGCLIYLERPESCKNFSCIWLSGGLPAELRPDKSKVIFERLPSGKTYLVLLNGGYSGAWREPAVQDIIDGLLKANRAIIIGTQPATYIMPRGRSLESVKEDVLNAAKEYGIM